jgi:hypothetical protein
MKPEEKLLVFIITSPLILLAVCIYAVLIIGLLKSL